MAATGWQHTNVCLNGRGFSPAIVVRRRKRFLFFWAPHRETRNEFGGWEASINPEIDYGCISRGRYHQTTFNGFMGRSHRRGDYRSGAVSFLVGAGGGLGLSSISPWSNEGVSATTFKVGAGIYLVCVAILASAVGGYLSGRLRHTWTGLHNDEIYFRDTAHGLITWAFATVLSATLLGAAATHIFGGAASGIAPAAAVGANNASNPTDIYVDSLLRTDLHWLVVPPA